MIEGIHRNHQGRTAAGLLAVSPLFVDKATVSLLFYLMMWVCLAQSFNLFTGLTGYVNFGNVAFYGVGAYAAAVAMAYWDAPPYFAIIFGGALSALLALGMSFPTLRLRGAYFAIATLSIQQAVFVLFDNWGYVNTAAGISIPVKFYDPVLQYYAMLVVSARSIRRTVSATVESDAATPARSSPRPKSKAFAARGDSPPASRASVLWVLSVISPLSCQNRTRKSSRLRNEKQTGR